MNNEEFVRLTAEARKLEKTIAKNAAEWLGRVRSKEAGACKRTR